MSSQDQLEQQALLLTSRDWNTRRMARDALIAAGSTGLAVVLRGLDHAEPLVRRRCLDFLDHHADELCIDDLRRVALHDPVPQVRRFAVHALSCVRCKTSPLRADLVDFVALVASGSDENVKVRREAIYMLGQLPKSSRAVTVLKQILEQESDAKLRKAAHRVLRLHDPEFRRVTDERARQASLARTRRCQPA
ncbi:MAG: HEAT repeat domain-containing protein [Chloroflexi bacterium]|nr:HEAT repeat domain-containing protein [Chloroflexota bacterium]